PPARSTPFDTSLLAKLAPLNIEAATTAQQDSRERRDDLSRIDDAARSANADLRARGVSKREDSS
ncbi:MAG: hypothetical protein ABIT01_05810, partial [Thermoanaerobaculia bacterium]